MGTRAKEDPIKENERFGKRASSEVHEENYLVIAAEPTKRFFIEMLVRDIGLLESIADLVDNSVDGARNLRQNPVPDRYTGLWVNITLDENRFIIEDNCGGIPIDLARNYAFRFGRPLEMKTVDHSIGQFGVGMKRAIFKMGNYFEVRSRTVLECFTMYQDVREWEKKVGWTMEFANFSCEDTKLSEPGTRIEVTQLHESVQVDFADPIVLRQLRLELEAAHQRSMEDGLRISLNGSALKGRNLDLLRSSSITPSYRSDVFELGDGKPAVSVRLWAGVGPSSPQDAGWNVFCNDRLVLENDRSSASGWGGRHGRTTIPHYHNQFARFRGFAFFECIDANLLPWNTTKTAIDVDSSIYKATRESMSQMMRPIINFLNELDGEERGANETPLLAMVDSAAAVSLSDLNTDTLP